MSSVSVMVEKFWSDLDTEMSSLGGKNLTKNLLLSFTTEIVYF